MSQPIRVIRAPDNGFLLLHIERPRFTAKIKPISGADFINERLEAIVDGADRRSIQCDYFSFALEPQWWDEPNEKTLRHAAQVLHETIGG